MSSMNRYLSIGLSRSLLYKLDSYCFVYSHFGDTLKLALEIMEGVRFWFVLKGTVKMSA